MANENLAIDENMRNTLGAVTNDGNEEIRRVRVNPVTGALLVEANVVSTNTSIGSTIPGATQGSVFFAGVGGTLDQDNTNFFWDDSTDSLGIGTNSPNANIHVIGTAIITGDGGTPDELIGRESGSGFLSGVTVGAGLSIAGGVLSNTVTGAGYHTIQNQGVSVTQRSIINLSNLLTAADNAGKTDLTINVTNLAADSTFNSSLDLSNIGGLLDLSTQVTGLLDVSNIDVNSLANDATFISALEPNLDLTNIGGLLDLTTQVTGTLPVTSGGTGATTLTGVLHGDGTSAITAIPLTTDGAILIGDGATAPTTLAAFSSSTGTLKLANGGTAANLSDPGANRLWGWDDTDNSIGFWAIGSGLTYTHATHTLSASGGAPVTASTQSFLFDDFIGGTSTSGDTKGIGELGWLIQANVFISVEGDSTHPGVLRLEVNGVGDCTLYLGGNLGEVETPNSTYEFMMKMSATTDEFACGITNNVGGDGTGTDKCLFIVATAGGNWQGWYNDGTGQVTVGSIAVTTNYVRLTIVTNGAGNSAEFFVDGVSLGTIAIASSGSGSKVVMSGLSGVPTTAYKVDYFSFNRALSR